jgi:hypothetical protein
MTQTPRLNLPFIAPAQAQKHITVNEAFRQIDRLGHISVISREVEIEPSDPQNGDNYILPANATGTNWSQASPSALAFYDEGWVFITPQEGYQVWIEEEQKSLIYSNDQWIALPITEANVLGVNAEADDVNRLSVKSDVELLSHDDITPGTGDARKVINKKSTGHTASLLFQNAYQGHAELGLMGEDDFAIKTSLDGTNFETALRVNRTEEKVELFHPLTIKESPVLSVQDRPCFVANIASANTSYSNEDTIELNASLDTHNGFDAATNRFIVPVSGVYFVQIGVVIRSVTSGLTIVRLRAFKNETSGQSVNAVTADANITTVNDSSLLEFSAGDTLSLKTSFNDTDGAVQFFPSSRLLMYRIV